MADFNVVTENYNRMEKGGATKAEVEAYLGHNGFTFPQFITRVGRNAKAGGKTVEAGFGRLFAQGISLGFADELEAHVRELNGQDYDKSLQAIRNGIADYREENGGTALVAEMAGALAPTIGALIAAPFTGGSSAAVVAPTLGRLALRGAGVGGGTGLVAGFNAGEGGVANRLKSGALSGAIGAVGGFALPVAATSVKGAYNALRPIFSNNSSREIVGDALNSVATNPQAVPARLRGAPEYVPGSRPTTAQAAQDPGIAALQTPVRSNYDTQNRIAQQLSQQNSARQSVLGRISGESDEAIKYAERKRNAITGPKRENAFDSSQISDEIIPGSVTLVVKKMINDLIKTPAGKRRTVASALNSAKKDLEKADSLRALYEIRKDLRLAAQGKLSGPRSDFRLAKRQLQEVIDEVDNIIESGAPGYREYMNSYRKMSRPIDQMKMLQELRRKSEQAGPDVLTGQNVLSQAKMKSQMVGVPDGVLSQSQTRQLNNVMTDLNRSTAPTAPFIKVPGSETAKNLTVGNVMGRMLSNPNSSFARVVGDKLGFLYGLGPESRVRELLIDAMQDPRLAADLMEEATDSSMARLGAALRSKMRMTGGAASIGTAGGLLDF
tara:strand:- start:2021 stop:3850 length:1830 start_codon:yes stop_codon:yes gene_type:complete